VIQFVSLRVSYDWNFPSRYTTVLPGKKAKGSSGNLGRNCDVGDGRTFELGVVRSSGRKGGVDQLGETSKS